MCVLQIGTDTVKRGVSPAASLTSTSTNRFRESGSSYSIKQDHDVNKSLNGDRKNDILKKNSSSYGPSSSDLLPSRSVLFSSEASSIITSNSIKDHYKSSLSNTTNSTGVTASTLNNTNLTRSPLSQQRILQTNTDSSSYNSLRNQTISSSTLGSYHFPSININLNKNASNLDEKLNTTTTTNNTTANTSSMRQVSSPSRTISNTSTLPSNLARNMLYQSESSYSIKNQQINFTSPGNMESGSHYSNSNNAKINIYGTLPKTSSNHQPYSSSATSSDSQELFNTLSQSISSSALGGNSNTLGAYRVQYSSTNPFLPTYNPPPGETSVSPVPTINLNISDKIDEE